MHAMEIRQHVSHRVSLLAGHEFPPHLFISHPPGWQAFSQSALTLQSMSIFDGMHRYMQLGKQGGGKLGTGSFGIVYTVWDDVNSKLVAIIEQPVSSDSAECEMLFFHSIPVHPHLFQMHDQFVNRNMLHLVFQYLEASLHDIWHPAMGVPRLGFGRQVRAPCPTRARSSPCTLGGTSRPEPG
jgi:hypothetical protein